MPWCPSCRCEFREGFTRCADCGVDLVDVLPASSPNLSVAFERISDPCELMNEFDPFKIALATQMLENNDIAVYTQDTPAGSYLRVMTGGSIGGKTLFVDRSRLEEAQALLRVYLSGDGEAEPEDGFDPDAPRSVEAAPPLDEDGGEDGFDLDAPRSVEAAPPLEENSGEDGGDASLEEPSEDELRKNEQAYLRRRKTGRYVVLGYLLAPFVLIFILKLIFS